MDRIIWVTKPMRIVSFLLCIISSILAIKGGATGCGNACHALHPEKVNIHLVAHTHDDVGWLKTADQYFYGSNKDHAPFGVQYILDSVISELAKNPDRRFIYVETAYFSTWWEELPESDKPLVRQLVQEGRLEFVHGGWCMSDEAAPHYTAMIDQMTLGLQFLNNTFGECARPTVSWQIDPFGHSSEVAIEFAEMGFDGLFVGRIDFEDFRLRAHSKNLESIWRPDPSLGEAGDLFTSVLYNLYMAPDGFCFDTYCSDEPIMDNKKARGYNVDQKIKLFEAYMTRYQKAYKTKNILVTMGGDFTYTSASSWFRNMDKLIKYMNAKEDSPFHVLYSTPSCYLKAVNDESQEWPVKELDDYFPYGSDRHSYWTGYYTSRPSFKYYATLANNILRDLCLALEGLDTSRLHSWWWSDHRRERAKVNQSDNTLWGKFNKATKQIATILGTALTEEEFDFKKAVAMAQHHDGVTGTEKQYVTSDYSSYLQEGITCGQKIFSNVYSQLYGGEYPSEQDFGLLRNISQFGLTENQENFLITIYNPLSRTVSMPVRFPAVKDTQYELFDRSGGLRPLDSFPLSPNTDKIPGRQSNATHNLVFIARDLPPLGTLNYYVRASKTAKTKLDVNSVDLKDSAMILDNGRVKLTFDSTSGLLVYLTKADGSTIPFQQNFYWYMPTEEDPDRPDKRPFTTPPELRASGAYIFRPINQDAQKLFANANIKKYEGANVLEVHQTFSNWLSQVVRLYRNSDDIEFEWLVGPLPVNKTMGMELVTRYTTDLNSGSIFYTDSNGRRWVQRIRNYRKYWSTNSSKFEPTSSNYYPLTTSIAIKDDTKQLTVITDRPQGGTSLKDGQIEVMLHRRLLFDDDKGVSEPLNESAFGEGLVVRGVHVVQMNDIAMAADAHRLKAIETVNHPVPMFAKTHLSLNEWLEKYNRSYSLLAAELPSSVQVLTLERWQQDEILLRLEHIFERNETSTKAKPEIINLKTLFPSLDVSSIRELTLAANLEKNKLRRMKWTNSGQTSEERVEDLTSGSITLQPMQIRTFVFRLDMKESVRRI